MPWRGRQQDLGGEGSEGGLPGRGGGGPMSWRGREQDLGGQGSEGGLPRQGGTWGVGTSWGRGATCLRYLHSAVDTVVE